MRDLLEIVLRLAAVSLGLLLLDATLHPSIVIPTFHSLWDQVLFLALSLAGICLIYAGGRWEPNKAKEASEQ